MYFRFFFVFVCLCAAVYGVIKNNNLLRSSSIVPLHIIYQVNLYWRNNSAHKYNYFETVFHTLAFHTNFSRIFHPCKLVPHFHVSHFQSPQLNSPSSSSSTVELVDDTYATIDESWLFTTSRSTSTCCGFVVHLELQLTWFRLTQSALAELHVGNTTSIGD